MTIVEDALIKNTTREQREQRVKYGFAIGSVESLPPSERLKELSQQYIDGELEAHEIVEILKKEFTERVAIANEKLEQRGAADGN